MRVTPVVAFLVINLLDFYMVELVKGIMPCAMSFYECVIFFTDIRAGLPNEVQVDPQGSIARVCGVHRKILG